MAAINARKPVNGLSRRRTNPSLRRERRIASHAGGSRPEARPNGMRGPRSARTGHGRRAGDLRPHHVLHDTASFEEEPPSFAEMMRRRGVVIGHGLPYLVAELDGAVVGYSYAMPYHARS